MKLKDLLEQYGEYEVSETKGDWCDAGHITLELEKPKPKSVWDLEIRDIYYDLHSDGQIHPLRYEGKESDTKRIINGSAFITKEEAEQGLERRRVEALLLRFGGRRWFKKNGENWFLYLDDYNIVSRSCTKAPYQGMIYFDTHGEAVDACEKIGSSRIKKALFEVR